MRVRFAAPGRIACAGKRSRCNAELLTSAHSSLGEATRRCGACGYDMARTLVSPLPVSDTLGELKSLKLGALRARVPQPRGQRTVNRRRRQMFTYLFTEFEITNPAEFTNPRADSSSPARQLQYPAKTSTAH
jgi:hypothetical protein